ncbi:FecR family protein [Chitinophaga barathri]|uniref:FecR family protein n=1 Tax=Chitinophaga barathri TaxID=1647451 RepID=A0A3N4MJR9_9BACT|nr:FecR family protein [Chitinophaga barathri]RPD42127.1 FecR family protein [Chitinophaga barathri]
MNIQHFKRIIDRFLQGDAGQEEEQLIRQWFAATDKEPVTLGDEERKALAGEIKLAVDGRIGITRPARVIRMRRLLRYAAIFAVPVLGLSVYLIVQYRHTTDTYAFLHFEAPAGEMRKITLSDSSMIYLFPGTRLDVPDRYGETSRSVKVAGRAFFDVRQNVGKVFEVQSGKLTTTVLGTSFEVKEGADKLIVSVRTGKVRVHYGARLLSDITAGDRLVMDTAGKGYVLEHWQGKNAFNWISGGLSFRQTPLHEALDLMADWYKVKMIIRNTDLEKEKVTANLEGQTLEAAMTVLSQTVKFRYEHNGNQIVIY